MALGQDLLVTARRLARANPKKPRQADLRRAVSTTYYAVFHALAQNCADRFIGTGSGRNEDAWRQTYRALDHGPAKQACQRAADFQMPPEVLRFAVAFRRLQEERHAADYDPLARFSRSDVLVLIDDADQAIHDLRRAPRPDQTGFAALVLFKRR
jgi:uncharacterized protein (UPF0332 family)